MSREAMKLALEALETELDNYKDWDEKDGAPEYIHEAITTLREALASEAIEQPAPMQPELFACDIEAKPLYYPLNHYLDATSTEGPLGYTWTDKPHRLIYDLIAAVKYYALTEQPAPVHHVPVAIAKLEGQWPGTLFIHPLTDIAPNTKLYTSPQPAPVHHVPVAFLANGTRFKISYDARQSGGQIHGIPPELGGRWVAFVAADDDCHLKLTSPPAQRKPLTSAEIREWWASENGLEDCAMSKLDDFEKVVRAIETKLKEKNQ